MKRFMLGLSLLSCLYVVSAQPARQSVITPELNAKVITIEPGDQECVVKCLYFAGVFIGCFTYCY